MGRPPGAKNKRTLVRESLARKGVLGAEDIVVADSLAIMEQTMMHFYLRAMKEKQIGTKASEKRLDYALERAAHWAKEIAVFKHAKLASMKLIGDPNNPVHFKDDATAEELRAEITRRLNILQSAGILELEALPDTEPYDGIGGMESKEVPE